MKPVVDPKISECVSALAQVDMLNGRYRVSLPIVMPSGGLVDVSIYPEPGGTFTVTDDGNARFDVSSYTVSNRSFNGVAREKAAHVGANFDGESVRLFRINLDMLRVAIIMIGNLSADIAHEVVSRAAKAQKDRAKDQLFETLDRAFAGKPIAHDVGIFGDSTAEYEFDAVVELGRRRVAFDIFTKDPVSVAATYTKLSDVSRSEEAPRLVGVTRDPNSIGPKLTLVASVARVIRLGAETETFLKAAEAA